METVEAARGVSSWSSTSTREKSACFAYWRSAIARIAAPVATDGVWEKSDRQADAQAVAVDEETRKRGNKIEVLAVREEVPVRLGQLVTMAGQPYPWGSPS